MYLYKYIDIYIYTYIHTYTHTYAYTHKLYTLCIWVLASCTLCSSTRSVFLRLRVARCAALHTSSFCPCELHDVQFYTIYLLSLSRVKQTDLLQARSRSPDEIATIFTIQP